MQELTINIGTLPLDDGTLLPSVEQRVTIYGTPNAQRDNLVLVAHALTGNSRCAEWWPGFIGTGGCFDPEQWCIIGINALTKERVTVRDIVRAQRRTLDELGYEGLRFVVGGSLGGMQALQWALDSPERVEHALVIGAHDHQSAMGIALNAVQRDAIALDPKRGLGLARKIAMLSYKCEELFNERHDRKRDRRLESRFDIEGYLEHQAERFIERFDPQTYVTLTHAMDSFDVRDRANEAHSEITFVGISSDWLFRPQDVRTAAARFGSRYVELKSNHGHDAFLAEAEALRSLLVNSGVHDRRTPRVIRQA